MTGEGNSNPLQYSCLEKNLVGYSPWGCKELDTTERLTHTHTHIYDIQAITIINNVSSDILIYF